MSVAPACAELAQHVGERGAAGGVEPGVRLVEQHDARLVDDRPRDRHALLQSAAQRAHAAFGAVGDAHPLERAPTRRREETPVRTAAPRIPRSRSAVKARYNMLWCEMSPICARDADSRSQRTWPPRARSAVGASSPAMS